MARVLTFTERPEKLGPSFGKWAFKIRFIFAMNLTIEYRKTTVLIKKFADQRGGLGGGGEISSNSRQIYFVSDLETL